MGIFDLYNITPKSNHIKMGTLGKAYGSFGAYILASEHIIEYLLNRAKPLIYATSLSLYDTKLAHNALVYIQQNTQSLQEKIQTRRAIIKQELGMDVAGLIVPIPIGDNKKVLKIKEKLLQAGYAVGAIRQPTVKSAIIRLIARLGESKEDLLKVCRLLQEERKA